jgi:hypothetical protein
MVPMGAERAAKKQAGAAATGRGGEKRREDGLLDLQREAGNRAVSSLFAVQREPGADAGTTPVLKSAGKADTSKHGLTAEQEKEVPDEATAKTLSAEAAALTAKISAAEKAVAEARKAGRDTAQEVAAIAVDKARKEEIGRLLDLRQRADEGVTLTANKISGGTAAWFADIQAVTFLGRAVQVHRLLAERLALAEKELSALPVPPGGWLDSTPSGLRATAAGLHSFGLAIDLNPGTNPWLLDPARNAGSRSARSIQDIIDRANLLVLGRTAAQESFTSRPNESDRDKRVEASYDKLQESSQALERYFTLSDTASAAELGGLVTRLGAADPSSRTAEQWVKTIADDRRALGALAAPKQWHNPAQGFLHLDRRLVKAMTNSAGADLTWLGDDTIAAGRDIMHFDMRRVGPIHKIVDTFGGTRNLGNG